MKVSPLPFNFLIVPGDLLLHFLPTFAASLTTGQFALLPAQRLFGLSEVARIIADLILGRDIEYLESHINSSDFAGFGQGMNGYAFTGKATIPTVRLLGDGNGLGGAFPGPMYTDTHAANLGEPEQTAVYHGSIAILRIGK